VSAVDEARIQQLCRALRCTPAVLFLGALQIWLARSSGGKAPPVCVPMQLRDDLEASRWWVSSPTSSLSRRNCATVIRFPAFFQKLGKRFYDAWSHSHTPFGEVSSLYSGERRVPAHHCRDICRARTTPEALTDVPISG